MTDILTPEKDSHWLVYRHSIETNIRRGAASKTITEYVESIGYTQTQISPTLQFERGTTMASLYNPNPKSQKTELSIDFASVGSQTVVEVQMRVNCMGNRPLSKDFDFWQMELSGMRESLEYGYVNPMFSQIAAERAQWYNIAIMLLVTMLAMTLTFAGLVGFFYLTLFA